MLCVKSAEPPEPLGNTVFAADCDAGGPLAPVNVCVNCWVMTLPELAIAPAGLVATEAEIVRDGVAPVIVCTLASTACAADFWLAFTGDWVSVAVTV